MPMSAENSGKSSPISWRVDMSASGTAIYQYLAGALALPEEEAADLIDFGSIAINGRGEKNPRRVLAGGEEIRVTWPWYGTKRSYEIDPARILFRDSLLLAYDKEAGVPSQQTPADAYNNLFAALYRYVEREGARVPYVALHHRLDRETSGVMLFAIDRSVNLKLGNAFQSHNISKEYLAWVDGAPPRDRWTASEDISRKAGRYCTCPKGEGKSARTEFTVLHREPGRALVLARPLTGRTHQIRLHLAACGHPVVGDRLYGIGRSNRLHLHAFRLKLPKTVNGCELTITAPLPPDWPLLPPEAIPD
jgi:23S rRNA pseudouridine1911/1915/1917 synthase